MNLTLILIIANVIFSYQGFQNYSFFNKYEFSVRKIQQGEYFRLISSGFLHANWQHLIFNMITLFFFAPIVLSLGWNVLLLVYFLSLISGNLLSLYLYRNDPFYTAIGASGATTGVLYSAILINPQMTIILWFFPVPAYIFGIGYLLYSIYGMKKQNDNIGHSAHLGGAICGYLITLLLYPQIAYTHTVFVILLAVPIVLLFWGIHKGNI